MKRDESLAPLSRDHHQALHQALLLKRAGEADRADVRQGALTFWEEHGSLHFRIEEDLLLPAYAAHADPAREEVSRVLTDHVWIRSRMAMLREPGLALDGLHELGDRLQSHVRHEERVLFPLIEEALPEAELAALGQAIAAAEAGPASSPARS